MGMDCYLVNPKTGKDYKVFNGVDYDRWHKKIREAVRLRDSAKDQQQRTAYQIRVEEACDKLYSRGDMFRDVYNSYSLTNWLMWNVCTTARGSWGMRLFVDVVDNKPTQIIESKKLIKKMRDVAKRWYDKAYWLKNKETLVGYPLEGLMERVPVETKSIGLNEWIIMFGEDEDRMKKKEALKKGYLVVCEPNESEEYVRHAERLVNFLENAVKYGAQIRVSY